MTLTQLSLDAPQSDPTDEDDALASAPSPRRNGRRALLLGGTAVLATACGPFGTEGDGEASTPDDDAPETLDLFEAEQAIVDDGEGNTEPDLQGPLVDPDAEADGDVEAGDQTEPSSSTSTTTAGATTTVVAAAPTTTAAPSPTTPSTTAPTTAPTTAAPTTAAPAPTTTAAPTTAPPTTAPPTTVAAPAPPAASARLVTSRLTFGITPEVDADVIELGIDGWVDDQLTKTDADATVETLIEANFANLKASANQGRLAILADSDYGREAGYSQLLRARYSSHQLYEMMTQLWSDHLTVNFADEYVAYLAPYQENVIRPYAMGRFADLLVASAHSGAMMTYLDNALSDARSGINENYGRELLELHTLGIHQDGSQVYGEADIIGAAHVMSGWSRNGDETSATWGEFAYVPEFHSTEPVSLLDGQWTNTGLDGKAAGDSLLQFLATHESTARYIAFKICRKFVADAPSDSLINSAAQVYLANDTAIVPVLAHVFASAEFAESGGDKARRPFELLSAAMRSLGTSMPLDPLSEASGDLLAALSTMGHEPWMWATPDGYPDDAVTWVSATSMVNGWNFTARLARDELTNSGDAQPLVTDLSALRGNAATAAELFERITFRTNLGDLPADLRGALLSLIGADDDTPAGDVTDADLIDLTTFLLAHPLFHLR